MPIYNTESYIKESVDSILSQTIGFEQNCEIIFINDGSTDGSEDICLEYKNKYPDNIVYIKQTNKGVSAARNKGLTATSGKYVSFVDSDDKISNDSLEKVYNFFEKHYSEIDLCTIKMDFFGAKDGEHYLNDKFTVSRVVDIEKDYQHVISAIGPCFIKATTLSQGYKFDTALEVTEDGKFLTEILLDKMCYGAVSGPTYYYRKRIGEESAVSGRWNKKSWYSETPERCFEYLFEYSTKLHGYIPKYVQYFVMYHMKWAIRRNTAPPISDRQTELYRQKIRKILQSIDNEVIIKQKDFSVDYRVYTIAEKAGKSVGEIVKYRDGHLIANGTVVQKIKNIYTSIDFIYVKNGHIEIEGCVHGYDIDGFKFGFSVGDSFFEAEAVNRPYMERHSLGAISYRKIPFVVKVPIKKRGITKLRPTVSVGGAKHYIRALRFNRFTKLSEDFSKTYAVVNGNIVQYRRGFLTAQRYKRTDHIKKEIRYMKQLIDINRYDAVWLRLVVVMAKIYHRKPVWVVSDRLVSAGDNGEALFRYISKQNSTKQKVYFAINKNSPDFNRMKKYGSVVDRQSFKYKVLFLLSDKIISSHFDKFVTDAFSDTDKSQRNLYNFDFIFLRHGVSKDDMSKQINKYKVNISLLMSSSNQEYDHIVNNIDKYGYTKDNIKLTGLPRYDYLKNKPNKILIVAPTWRSYTAVKPADGTDKRFYDKKFIATEYFKFYNDLINDKRLVKSLSDKSMKCEFYLHPALSEQVNDFQENEVTTIKPVPHDYKRAFSEGEVLVTDYSSVAFDFAYLKKPVLYTQFDKDQFFQQQYKPGYFSYQDDGFGDVVYDYESAVRGIISIIEGGCTMPDMFKARVDNFFAYNDRNNSKRVLEAIQNHEG